MSNDPASWGITIENEAPARPLTPLAPGNPSTPPPDITLRITHNDEDDPVLEVRHATDISSRPHLLKQLSATLHDAPRLEAIVRALAAQAPVQQTGWDETFTACALCDASNAHEMDKPIQEMEGVRLTDHTEDCPWRRAVEWTQQHPR